MRRIILLILAFLLVFCGCEKKDPLEEARNYRSLASVQEPPEFTIEHADEMALLSIIQFDLECNYEYLIELYREILGVYDELEGFSSKYSEVHYQRFYDVWNKHVDGINVINSEYMGDVCSEIVSRNLEFSENAYKYAVYLRFGFDDLEKANTDLVALALHIAHGGGAKKEAEYVSDRLINIKDRLAKIDKRISKTTALSQYLPDEFLSRKNVSYVSVSVEAKCIENNSVGDSWDVVYAVNGVQKQSATEKWLIKVWDNAEVSVNTIVTEEDSVDDVGRKNTTFIITDNDLRHDFEIEQTVIVRENRGRYSGNTAEWKIVYTFEP